MAITKTPNIQLNKAEISDVVDLDLHFNENADIIDAEMKKRIDDLDEIKSYGFGGGTFLLAEDTNLNTVTKQGIYNGVKLKDTPYPLRLTDNCLIEVFEKGTSIVQRLTYTSDDTMWYRKRVNDVWTSWSLILNDITGVQSSTTTKELIQRHRSSTVGVNPGAETKVTFTFDKPYLDLPVVTHSLLAGGAYEDVFSVVESTTVTKAIVKIKNNSPNTKYFIVNFIVLGSV